MTIGDGRMSAPMYTIYLGSREGARWLPSEITDVLDHTRRWVKFATIIEATGIYKRQVVPTLLIKIASHNTHEVHTLAANLGIIHHQTTVGVECNGQLDIINSSDFWSLL